MRRKTYSAGRRRRFHNPRSASKASLPGARSMGISRRRERAVDVDGDAATKEVDRQDEERATGARLGQESFDVAEGAAADRDAAAVLEIGMRERGEEGVQHAPDRVDLAIGHDAENATRPQRGKPDALAPVPDEEMTGEQRQRRGATTTAAPGPREDLGCEHGEAPRAELLSDEPLTARTRGERDPAFARREEAVEARRHDAIDVTGG